MRSEKERERFKTAFKKKNKKKKKKENEQLRLQIDVILKFRSVQLLLGIFLARSPLKKLPAGHWQ